MYQRLMKDRKTLTRYLSNVKLSIWQTFCVILHKLLADKDLQPAKMARTDCQFGRHKTVKMTGNTQNPIGLVGYAERHNKIRTTTTAVESVLL